LPVNKSRGRGYGNGQRHSRAYQFKHDQKIRSEVKTNYDERASVQGAD